MSYSTTLYATICTVGSWFVVNTPGGHAECFSEWSDAQAYIVTHGYVFI